MGANENRRGVVPNSASLAAAASATTAGWRFDCGFLIFPSVAQHSALAALGKSETPRLSHLCNSLMAQWVDSVPTEPMIRRFPAEQTSQKERVSGDKNVAFRR